MSGKKRGRKPSGNRVREVELSYSLTAEDAQKLADLADGLGFKSRSEMVTAIFERLALAGWAPVAWLKLGWLLRNRAQETGHFEDCGWWNPFEPWEPLPVEDKPPRPTPALSDEQLTAKETKTLLAEVRKQLTT